MPNFFSTTFFVSQIEQEPDCHQCIDLKSDTKKIKAISNYFSSENNSKTLGTKSQERTGNQKLIARELVRTYVTDDIKIQDDWAIVDDKNSMKKEMSYNEDRYHGNESKSYGIETDALFFNENNGKSNENTKKRKLEAEEEKKSEKIDIKNYDFVSTKRENTYEIRENNFTEDRDKEKDFNGGNDDENENMDLPSGEIIEELLCPICSFKLNNLIEKDKNHHVNLCCNKLDDDHHDNINKNDNSNNDQTVNMKINVKKNSKLDQKSNETKNKKSPNTKIDVKGSIQNYFHISPKKN